MTFATSAAAREARFSVLFTIEGWGDAGGLFKACTQIPNYAVGDAHYRPIIMDWPSVLSERVDVQGGLPEAGEFSAVLLDWMDLLTSEFRVEADPLSFVENSVGLDSTGTSLELTSYAGMSTADGENIVYIGNEALKITAGTGPFTVTRGVLDTDAYTHPKGAPVFVRLPYLHRRRMRVFVAPIDGASSSDEEDFGSYSLDVFELSEDLNSYVIRGKSQLKWLGRQVARRKPWSAEIISFRELDGTLELDRSIDQRETISFGGNLASWPSSRVHLKINDEIVIASTAGRVFTRAVLGTKKGEIKTGDRAVAVYGADPNDDPQGLYPTFFRYSPGPSPSSDRNTGTWIRTAHFVDLIFCLAMSSADPADGFELNNRNASFGAWDALPVGLGIGIPNSLIDLQAGINVRSRTPDWIFPDFVVGAEPVTFGDLITEHFLRPLGAYFATAGGKARIVLPRFPMPDESTIEIGPADLLRRPVGRGLYGHAIKAAQDISTITATIVARLRDGTRIVVHNTDFGATYGQAGYYATEEPALEFDVPSVRPDASGFSDFLYQAMLRRLVRFRRPLWKLFLPVDISKYSASVGDLVGVTYPELPNLATGVRGVTSMISEIVERTFRVSPERGAVIEWNAISYGSGLRAGRIAPSGRIASVANAASNPVNVTITTNRYTQSDIQDGLPATDAAAFRVGDVLRLRNRNGTSAAAGTQTITGITGSVLDLNGNFSGALTNGTSNAGLVLEYAGRASAAAQQYNGFVYCADKTNRTVGASTQTPWKFGEA